MEKRPVVSIIIPVYNAEAYIEENINGMLRQTYNNIEVIYVCDGCTDRTVDILDKYNFDERIKIIKRENNLGAAASRNQGAKIASGDWMIFWDVDDIVKDNAIELMLDRAMKYDADMVICAYGNVGEEKSSSKNLQFDYLKEMINTYPLFLNDGNIFDLSNQIVSNAPFNKLISRRVYDSNNVWFQNIKNCNDVYYSVSAFLNAYKIVYIDEKLYWYRKDVSGNISHTRTDINCCILQALELIRQLMIKMAYDEKIFKNYARTEMIGYRNRNVFGQICLEYTNKYKDEWKISLDNVNLHHFDRKELVGNKKIVIYGAGQVGKDYYFELKNIADIIGWVDSIYEDDIIKNVKSINSYSYDYVIIATKSDNNAVEMQNMLLELGVDINKIIMRYPLNVECD